MNLRLEIKNSSLNRTSMLSFTELIPFNAYPNIIVSFFAIRQVKQRALVPYSTKRSTEIDPPSNIRSWHFFNLLLLYLFCCFLHVMNILIYKSLGYYSFLLNLKSICCIIIIQIKMLKSLLNKFTCNQFVKARIYS